MLFLPFQPRCHLFSCPVALGVTRSTMFLFLKILKNQFLAVLGLCCCSRAFSNGSPRGLLSGFTLRWPLSVQSTRLRSAGPQSLQHLGSALTGCRAGSLVVGPGLSCSQHARSSQTRGRTSVPCIARKILNHWTTMEAPGSTALNRSGESEILVVLLVLVRKHSAFYH